MNSRLAAISILILSIITSLSVQPLSTKDLLTLIVLPLIPLHFLCTHFWHLVHCIEFLPTPLPQTPHGHNLSFVHIYFHIFTLYPPFRLAVY